MTVFNPTQQHLLKLFEHDDSEEFAREVKMALTQYFQQKLDREADRLWEEGILDAKRLEELRHEDLHKKA